MVSLFGRVIAVGALVCAGQGAFAQSLRDVAVPAEFPPASYTGTQYVDSRGCVYIRAGLSGTVNWVPRVTRARKPMCGFQPTGVRSAGAAQPIRETAPVISIPQAAPTTTAEATPAPAQTVRPAPTPTPTTRTTTTPAPQPTVVSSPTVTPTAEPRRITKAEACAGRFGVQSGIINARTGQPLDCGPAPQAATGTPPAVVASPQAVAPLQRVRVGGNGCVQAVLDGSFEASGSDACTRQTRGIITGQAASARVSAPRPTAPTVISPQPSISAPAQSSSNALAQPSPWACLEAVQRGQTTITGPGGVTLNCAPQSQSPHGAGRGLPGNGSGADASTVTQPGIAVPRRSGTISQARLVRGTRPEISGAKPPAGYNHVWSDGRLNPKRGITVLRF